MGPDREEFLKGRRCENQGLGVSAFIYYRRVVENQKNRILGEIIKVSEKIGATAEKIEKLKSAVTETQFSMALDMAKDSMPESLLKNGHNPIFLLHSALSEGVHTLSDEQSLELAGLAVLLGWIGLPDFLWSGRNPPNAVQPYHAANYGARKPLVNLKIKLLVCLICPTVLDFILLTLPSPAGE